MHTNLYSVVFHPAGERLAGGHDRKDVALDRHPGDEGHFAVNTFTADARQLARIITYLEDFTRRAKPDPVAVQKAMGDRSLRWYVEEASAARLRLLMAALNHSFPVRACKIYDPRVSMMPRKKMKMEPDRDGLELDCDRLSLRQFDPYQQRYSRVRDFAFTGVPGGAQLELF